MLKETIKTASSVPAPTGTPDTLRDYLHKLLHCDHPDRCVVHGTIEHMNRWEKIAWCGACGAMQLEGQWLSPGMIYALGNLSPLEELDALALFANPEQPIGDPQNPLALMALRELCKPLVRVPA